jgi:hypothetical protein
MSILRTLRKITTRWGSLLALIGGTSSLWAQPVVQVPASCNVVVTGTGAGVLPGPGGKVGNGGIVVMPDPFDHPFPSTSGNFVVIPNGNTINDWALAGDLSFQTSLLTAIQSAGAATTQNIESYNKVTGQTHSR